VFRQSIVPLGVYCILAILTLGQSVWKGSDLLAEFQHSFITCSLDYDLCLQVVAVLWESQVVTCPSKG